jgi:hypothetical protein
MQTARRAGHVVALGFVVACGGQAADAPADSVAAVAAAPAVIEVRANEFAFTAPDTVPAGLTTIRMVADGKALHHAQLIRFDAGHTFDEFLAVLRQGNGPQPTWAHDVGGVNGADPGSSQETSVPLVPGEYALICFLPNEQGVPHAMLGMMKRIVVTGEASTIAPPATDVKIMATGAGFEISGPIAAGRRTLLVENSDSMSHEAILVKLADGATAQTLVDWVLAGANGPPPGSGRGGTVGLERGAWNVIHADLEPGTYGVFDFIPSGPDRRPNATKGMVAEFRVE